MSRFHTIAARGISVTLDLGAGHVRSLVVENGERRRAPLHTAPWIDDPTVTGDESLPGNLRHLSGDFFCAPFGKNDLEDGPPHGWPANSPWTLLDAEQDAEGARATYRLDRTVLGATLEKRFTLRHDHPFLYETHVFHGGQGAIPVANHAMVALPEGGRLAFSAKESLETPATPLERDPGLGRSVLAYPAQTSDPTRVPLADGSSADLTRCPFADRHEDFVMLVEARQNRFGWLAASRPATGDAMLSLKNPDEYPVTMLWFSNGGRDYKPWNGRHTGVLGIEEGRTHAGYGHRNSIGPNALTARGIPTALVLDPDGAVTVRNAIGVVALSPAGAPVSTVTLAEDALDLAYEDGTERRLPFDPAFLQLTRP